MFFCVSIIGTNFLIQKGMKKVLFISLILALCSMGMYAQDRGAERQKMMKERVDKYVKELKLDDEKAEKFRKTYDASMEKMTKEMQSARESGDRDAMREKMTKLNQERDAEIKKILTDDEYKKYEDLLSKEPRPGRRN